MTASELEREFEQRVRELKRQLLPDQLDRRGGGAAIGPVRDKAGRERIEAREDERKLRTTFGDVEVRRSGYGGEKLDSLHPLDGELHLPPELYSLELRRRVAREVARGSFEEAMEAVEETTGVHVPKRLLKYEAHLRYNDYLARGYPIASGVVKGACRHLVHIRMNRTGARWSLERAEAVLQLRALVKSGDFDDYWKLHEARELERNHRNAYAEKRLPRIETPARRSRTLRLVK